MTTPAPVTGDPVLMTIGPQPQQVMSAQPGGAPVMLVNTDENNTAYAGYNSAIAPGGTNTVAIPPLGSTVMSGTRTSYACAAQSLQLQIVPGGTLWTPSPAQIAAVLVGSELADVIAAAISAAGVPPIDHPTPVYIVFQQTVAAGGTFTTPEIDVSQYQSWVGTMFSAATAAGLGTDPYTKMHITWGLQTDNYDPLHAEDWVVPNTPFNDFYVYRNDLQGPCYGDHMQVTFTNYDTEPMLVTMGVFGSYRTRIRTAIRGRYAWNSDGSSDDAIGLGSDSIVTSYNVTGIAPGLESSAGLMNLFNGPVSISGSIVGGTAGDWAIHIKPQPFSVLNSIITIPAPAGQNNIPPTTLMLPRRVCTISVVNDSGTATITSAQVVITGQEQPE